jgi:hypothetical protein
MGNDEFEFGITNTIGIITKYIDTIEKIMEYISE